MSAYHFAAIPVRLNIEKMNGGVPERRPFCHGMPIPGLAITWLAKGYGEIHLADLKMAKQSKQKLAELQEIANERGDRNV